ncbi:MAG: hypothetical protein ACI4II_05140 [Acutalibacteraceae bacterium]
MKKINLLILESVFILMILCGCTRVIDCKADELVMNEWSFRNDFGAYADLSFYDDCATLTFSSDGKESSVISGQVLVSDSEIAITDEETQQNFLLQYDLYGDKVILMYNGFELTMNKKAATPINALPQE